MEEQTTLSRDIQTSDINAQYDAAVKRLLADKYILAWILHSCVEEFKNIDVKEIAEKYIEGTPQISSVAVMPDETNTTSRISTTGVEDVTVTEGTITFDIRFLAIAPKSGEHISLIINVEAQNNFYPGYPLIKRGLYYCSRMISSQYGTVFTKSHYEKIKKVYSIWICMNPPKGRENTITEYSITEKNRIGNVKEKIENYDLLTTIMICIGKPEQGDKESILRLLDVLLSPELIPDEKRNILKNDFSIPMTETVEREVTQMCNLSVGVMDIGRQEGREEGRQEGREKTILTSITSLMKTMNLSVKQAMDALEIPEQEQEKYKDMLKQ